MIFFPAPGFSLKKLLLKGAGFFIVLYSPLFMYAGNDNFSAGGRSSGISNASIALCDVWGTFNNQAGLAYVTAPTVSFYFENRFLLKELSMQAGTFVLPVKPGAFGISYRYFGYSKYYESKFGFTYSRKFTEYFSAGIQLDYLQTHIAEGYGNSNAVAAELSLLAKPASNFQIGFQIFNPTLAKHNEIYEGSIPTILRFGGCYSFEKKAVVFCEAEKDIDQQPIYKGAIEVNMGEKLFLRGGYSSGYEHYSFGLGYKLSHVMADLAFSRHNILGFTPHLSIGYEF